MAWHFLVLDPIRSSNYTLRARPKMNRRTIIALAVILLFSGFAFYSFRSALNPYVSFAQAATANRPVQVVGELTDEEIVYDRHANQLRFSLVDKWGNVARIVYAGAKPNNMEHAESVVVAGSFKGEQFVATKLLVKCPSKYEDGQGGR